MLLDHKADPNIVGTRGTALHAAIESGDEEIVNLLLNHGANVDAANAHGETPLFIAASMGKKPLVARLLQLKADPSIRDINGQSAIDAAKEANHPEVVEMLKKAGAR